MAEQEVQVVADSAKTVEQSLQSAKEKTEDFNTTLSNFINSASNSSEEIRNLSMSVERYTSDIVNSSNATDKQRLAFTLGTVAFQKFKESYTGLAGIDTGSLSTLSDKVRDISSMSNVKLPFIDQIDTISKISGDAERLQNVIIQLAAKTGNLDEVYSAAGNNLTDFNYVLRQQASVLNETQKATGLSAAQIQQYYVQLGTIPKAMDSIINPTGAASDSMNMLTASIQLQVGTGRAYSDIISDITEAYKDYNLTGADAGDQALRFAARMTEISNKFNVNLDAVRSYATGVSEAFKMFGNNAEGSYKIVNDYMGALQSTGLSGQNSLEIIKGLTSGISNLSVAQKAFLSQQTGGPGGLRGAFQIEKMLRDGDISGVMSKVEQQMRKQFGKITTLDEASKSEQAAGQLQKQVLMLRQGPLGQFAKSDQEAIRFIEALTKKDKGEIKVTDLKENVTTEYMKNGYDIQAKSYNALDRIRSIMESNQLNASIDFKDVKENMLSEQTGSRINENSDSARMRDDLTMFRKQSSYNASIKNQDLTTSLKSGTVRDVSGNETVENALELKDMATKVFPDLFKSVKNNLSDFISTPKSGSSIVGDNLNSEAARVASQTNNTIDRRIFNTSGTTTNTTINNNINKAIASAKTNPTQNPMVTRSIENQSKAGASKEQSSKIVFNEPLQIQGKMEVELFCNDCKQKYSRNAQVTSVNTAAGVPQ